MTTNAYNSRGQLLSTTDPLGETFTMTYDTNGYLRAIVGPLGPANDTKSFAYDVVGRLKAFTNTDGYSLTYSYDNLDRLTNITYPDGTFDVFTFSNLDLVVAARPPGTPDRQHLRLPAPAHCHARPARTRHSLPVLRLRCCVGV
jgi:YD repeat-containing protein